jgi:hypothetical protein
VEINNKIKEIFKGRMFPDTCDSYVNRKWKNNWYFSDIYHTNFKAAIFILTCHGKNPLKSSLKSTLHEYVCVSHIRAGLEDCWNTITQDT